ncbi:DUF4192 domain-containing protein [Nocardioides sp.]|uniref:DUF4192 domain-containing protein n=1 Tax=Nocardioides sp. TaxID=35761 RepID=UPI002736C66B|nr:DUF4192 domain-containing protein [Nocardioides sp.]MDP3890150.1 DUF4192 domain-containing protein [Nocardioides sp.]
MRSRTLRTPEDLLALVPTLFGFGPTESLVVIGIGGDPGVHARVDLPDDADAAEQAAESFVTALARVECGRACLVAYAADSSAAREAVAAVAARLDEAGVRVEVGMRTDGARYALLFADGAEGTEVPYDVAGHPLIAEAVYEGRVLHHDREALAATLVPDPTAVAAVETAAHRYLDRLGMGRDADAEVRWTSHTVRKHLEAGTVPGPSETGRLLVAMAVDLRARDALWVETDRESAAAVVDLTRHLACSAPADLRAAPAALLAFAAWLAGDGALAWCGLDVCQQVRPDYSMAGLVAHALEKGLPPTVWAAMSRADLGVPGLG